MSPATVTIPDDLTTALERRVADTEFGSVEEYVLFVLREVANDEGTDREDRTDEQASVEDRLEQLGYL